MENLPENGFNANLGHRQTCPMCLMINPSGLALPSQCKWCDGFGIVRMIEPEKAKDLLK